MVRAPGGATALVGADGVRLVAPTGAPGPTLRTLGWGREDALVGVDPAVGRAAGERVELADGALSEWWTTTPVGLEQGWTIATRPAGAGDLVVDLATDARVTAVDPRRLRLVTDDGATWRYDGLVAFDATGRRLPASAAPHGAGLRVSVRDAGAVYPVVIDPIVAPEDVKIVPSGAEPGEQTAYSTEILGDVDGDGYRDLALGAHLDDGGVGEAWIYYGAPGGIDPLREDPLLPPFPEPSGTFGGVVADAGDVDGDGYADLAVASMGASEVRGAVDVFYGGPGGIDPARVDRVVASDGEPADMFGKAVAGGGDIDGDGYDDLVVGAWSNDENGLFTVGAVYVYFGSATGIDPAREQRLLTNLVVGYGQLGNAVTFVGDVNGDGFDDIAAGAPNRSTDPYWVEAGRVYVWLGSAAGVDEGSELELVASNTYKKDHFGGALAGGDIDGDGYDDLVVGAWGRDAVASYLASDDEGAFYVYYGGPGGIDPQSAEYVLSPSLRQGAMFAFDGAIAAGDVDGDGFDDVVVGAQQDRLLAGQPSGHGTVQTFYGSALGIDLARAEATAGTDTIAVDKFGASVSVGDVDGDGVDDVLTGAPMHDAAGNSAGAAYLFLGERCVDGDADGWCTWDDCDDARDDVSPDATDAPGDGLDQDCDGEEACLVDEDGDGWAAPTGTVEANDADCDDPGEGRADAVGDCDDADPSVNPDAADDPADGIDSDCDGTPEDPDGTDPTTGGSGTGGGTTTEEPAPSEKDSSGGCGCRSGGGAGGVGLLGLAGLIRAVSARRARRSTAVTLGRRP